MTARQSHTWRNTSDEELIRSLYQEHGKALLTYARRLTADQDAAEEAVLETLIRAWRRPDPLAHSTIAVRGRLLTLANNVITAD